MNTKQMKNYIRKLRVQNDSVIAIKSDGEDDAAAMQLVETLKEAIKGTNLQGIVVMLVDDFDRVATLDVRTMNKLGWFRREQIESLFHKITTKKGNTDD